MGVRILEDSGAGLAALYCSTSDVAFGPVFYDDARRAYDKAQEFLDWLDHAPNWASYEKASDLWLGNRHDPRELTNAGLQLAYADWLKAAS